MLCVGQVSCMRCRGLSALTPSPPTLQVSTVTRTVNTGAAAAGGGQAGGSKTAAGRNRAALRENVRG